MNFLPFKKLTYLRLWLIPVIGYMTLVAVLCLIRLGGSESSIPYLDKIQHLIAYSVMGFLMSQVFQKKEFMRAALVCFVFSFGIECLQGMTTYRSFELADLVANFIGSTLGASFTRFVIPNLLEILDFKLKQSLTAKG